MYEIDRSTSFKNNSIILKTFYKRINPRSKSKLKELRIQNILLMNEEEIKN